MFTNLGLSTYSIVNKNIDSLCYQTVLDENLIPLLEDVPLAKLNNIVFQQDNVPTHREKSTIEFLKKTNILTTNWPPDSPDLNIIEHVCAAFKRKIHAENPIYIPDFVSKIHYYWPNIVTKKYYSARYGSMKTRAKRVLRKKKINDKH